MEPNETQLEMVRRHVLEGEGHLARQRRLIEQLRDNQPTSEAEGLLTEFEATQAEHKDHLRRIRDDQEAGLRDAGGELIFPRPPPDEPR